MDTLCSPCGFQPICAGNGHIDFQGVFDALRMADYDGWVSVEILPGEDPDKMAKTSIQYLKPLIQQYNKS